VELSDKRLDHDSQQRNEWSDDPLFWRAMEPALCAPSRLSAAEGDVEAILGCVELSLNATVLDLGCGPGAHAVAFARRGYRVTGVDTSRRLLDRARTAARREGVHVEWVEADMREFQRPSTFDLACSLYASFGFFDDGQNRQVLENVRTSLKPGGCLVLDLVGRETVARHGEERRWHEVDDVLYLEHPTLVDDGSSMVSDWIVVRDGNRSDFRVKQRLYSGTELRDLLLSIGFANVHLSGSLEGQTPYDESARRLVAVARKPTGSP
jgi:SAM-dependent methyltransferase